MPLTGRGPAGIRPAQRPQRSSSSSSSSSGAAAAAPRPGGGRRGAERCTRRCTRARFCFAAALSGPGRRLRLLHQGSAAGPPPQAPRRSAVPSAPQLQQPQRGCGALGSCRARPRTACACGQGRVLMLPSMLPSTPTLKGCMHFLSCAPSQRRDRVLNTFGQLAEAQQCEQHNALRYGA